MWEVAGGMAEAAVVAAEAVDVLVGEEPKATVGSAEVAEVGAEEAMVGWMAAAAEGALPVWGGEAGTEGALEESEAAAAAALGLVGGMDLAAVVSEAVEVGLEMAVERSRYTCRLDRHRNRDATAQRGGSGLANPGTSSRWC